MLAHISMQKYESFYQFTPRDFAQFFVEKGVSPGPSQHVMRRIYTKGPESLIGDTQINQQHRKLLEALSYELPSIVQKQVSKDGTVKFLVELADGKCVECVALSFNKKFTLCLSTQVGCAMGCTFCYTGKQGFTRHLKAFEIVGQYLLLWRYLNREGGHPMPPNIVFMGQGEPLHNFEQVKQAINILMECPTLSLGPRQITLSTVGYLPGLIKLNQLPPINIAFSLHGTFSEQRNQLIPTNQAHAMEEILNELGKIEDETGKWITFEYLLIKDINDREEDAHRLAKLLAGRKALVNLIPFNPFPGSSYQRPSSQSVDDFKTILVQYKMKTLIRTTRGEDILAACGQLANTLSETN
jgi:23S rRNA (adenine2503-C2)-methyltransferase